MARVKGQLQFPINDITNPNLQGNVTQTTQAPGEDGPFGFKFPDLGFGGAASQGLQAGQQEAGSGFGQKAIQGLQQGAGVANPEPLPPPPKPIQQPSPIEQAKQVQPTQQVQTLRKPVPVEQPKQVTAAKVETTPVQAAAPVENVEIAKAQTDLDLLSQFAKDSLSATEDPVSKAKFNQALTNIGLVDQAERDILQQRINNDPSLAGQPAGTALLSMLAREQGFDTSNLITNLSLESAQKIRDLNRFGFDALSNIVSFKEQQSANVRNELLQAGDISGYGSAFRRDTGIDIDISNLQELSPANQAAVSTQLDLMNAALVSGDLDAARGHFDTVTALSPNAFKGADFDSLGFADKSFLLGSEQDEAIARQVRLDINQGDFQNAIDGIEAQFDENTRITEGSNLFNTKSLEEINSALEASGQSPVGDKTELIGREDELFTAFKVEELLTESGKSVIDDTVDFFVSELGKSHDGFIPDDADMKLIRSFANEINTGGFIQTDSEGNVLVDPNELVKPWDDGSASQNEFQSWPIMDIDGKVTDPSEFFTESNPEPAPNTELGKYKADLDAKWLDYNLNTPRDDQVSMNAWFLATKAGTEEFDINNVPEGKKKFEGIPLPGDLSKTAVNDIIAGTREISEIASVEFKDISDEDIKRLFDSGKVIDFDNTNTFLRPGDFVNSGLKADEVRSATNNNTGVLQDSSAGEGKGTIVFINGELMRITKFLSKLKTLGGSTLDKERKGTVWAVPLAGGDEREVSSTGFIDL